MELGKTISLSQEKLTITYKKRFLGISIEEQDVEIPLEEISSISFSKSLNTVLLSISGLFFILSMIQLGKSRYDRLIHDGTLIPFIIGIVILLISLKFPRKHIQINVKGHLIRTAEPSISSYDLPMISAKILDHRSKKISAINKQ